MDIKALIESESASGISGIMQFRSELEGLMKFMKDNEVRSYLEIGVKGGHLVRFLQTAFQFDRTFACDLNKPASLENNNEIELFHGSSTSWGYRRWRKRIGHVGLVFIDADHTLKGVRKDYLREKKFPHQFLAFHDIANDGYPDLKRFWEEEVTGKVATFVNSVPDDTLINSLHRGSDYINDYRRRYGNSCGIGIVGSKSPTNHGE
jgi:hypothetical protein